MTIEELKNKRVGIIGLGVNNRALVGWLLKHGVQQITICDQKPTIRFDYPEWDGRVDWRLGDDHLAHLDDFDLLFRTPGRPYLSPPIQAAKQAGVTISSQTKLFFALCPAPIIGVTGTKGKGTTSTLILKMLERAAESGGDGQRVFLGGNIGKDPFEFLDDITERDWVVLELSSFQLQDMERSPHIGVVLDIGTDHLDHHRNREEYIDAKSQIVRHQTPQDFAVINFDSETAMAVGNLSVGEDWYFSSRVPVDRGAYVRWLTDETPREGAVILRDSNGKETGVIESSSLKLRGEHNLENIAAAVTAAHLAGATAQVMAEALAAFEGLPHRLEFVGTAAQRKFFNDSFATHPDSVMVAVKSFKEPIHLIVGGSSKESDFQELGQFIAQRSTVTTVIPLGDVEGPKIAASIDRVRTGNRPVILPPTHSMDEAVELAYRSSKPGDIILLSPGCASFDLFQNYYQRGEQFRHAAQRFIEENTHA